MSESPLNSKNYYLSVKEKKHCFHFLCDYKEQQQRNRTNENATIYVIPTRSSFFLTMPKKLSPYLFRAPVLTDKENLYDPLVYSTHKLCPKNE